MYIKFYEYFGNFMFLISRFTFDIAFVQNLFIIIIGDQTLVAFPLTLKVRFIGLKTFEVTMAFTTS